MSYKFDDDFAFVKDESRVKKIVRRVVVYFFVSITLAILYYLIFALFFNTDTEVRLKEEKRLIDKYYSTLEEKVEVLGSGVEVATQKDNEIYNQMFGSNAPDVNFFNDSQYSDLPEDIREIKENNITQYTALTLSTIKEPALRVEKNLLEAMRILESRENYPPMHLPVKDFNFAKTGASVGLKKSPYYGVAVTHPGIDIVGTVGEKVYAAGDGIVSNVKLSKAGYGNTVEIQHPSGHVTVYAHLNDISVKKGRSVKRGTQIGTIGISGASYAPHLHYEVHYNNRNLDPASYFYADLSPENYVKVYATSFLTTTSLD